jgi:hypothetical protein
MTYLCIFKPRILSVALRPKKASVEANFLARYSCFKYGFDISSPGRRGGYKPGFFRVKSASRTDKLE